MLFLAALSLNSLTLQADRTMIIAHTLTVRVKKARIPRNQINHSEVNVKRDQFRWRETFLTAGSNPLIVTAVAVGARWPVVVGYRPGRKQQGRWACVAAVGAAAQSRTCKYQPSVITFVNVIVDSFITGFWRVVCSSSPAPGVRNLP